MRNFLSSFAVASNILCRTAASKFSREFASTLGVPEYFVELLILIEDKRFPSHVGIDPVAIARALSCNLRNVGTRQGGSTITQQLYNIRQMKRYGRFTRGLRSKIPQIMFGLWAHNRLTKAEIIAEYINGVYWGRNYNGLDVAAFGYFNKNRMDLTVEESFFLVERLACPNRLPGKRLDVMLGRTVVIDVLNAHESSAKAVVALYCDRSMCTSSLRY